MLLTLKILASNTSIPTRRQAYTITMPLSILKIPIITTTIIVSNCTFAIWLTVFYFTLIDITFDVIYSPIRDLSKNKVAYKFCPIFVCQDALTVGYLFYNMPHVFCTIFEAYYPRFYLTFRGGFQNLFKGNFWIIMGYL